MKELYSFKGRSTRTEYWVSQILFVSFYILYLIGIDSCNDSLVSLSLIAMVIIFIPVVAIQVKRFHDMNKSGWFILINLIPYIGGLWNVIWLGFFEAVNENNNYGEDPRIKDL